MHLSSGSRHVAWVTVGRLSDCFSSTCGMGHGRTYNSRWVVGPQAGVRSQHCALHDCSPHLRMHCAR
eukprot:6979367-Alexandrium_andersonii.AAC.1